MDIKPYAILLSFLSLFGFGLALYVRNNAEQRLHDKSVCLNYTAQFTVEAPQDNAQIAVHARPLTPTSNILGYIHPGDQLMIDAVCETASGTDYKFTSQPSGLEGYASAGLLVPGTPVPGTIILLKDNTALYNDVSISAAGSQFLRKGVHAVILEGPRVGSDGFVGYKVRALDSAHPTGWIPSGAVDVPNTVNMPIEPTKDVPKTSSSPWFLLSCFLILTWVPLGIRVVNRKYKASKRQSADFEPSELVPYCYFKRSSEGFQVVLMREFMRGFLRKWAGQLINVTKFQNKGFVASVLFGDTIIEVTKDSVLITTAPGKKLADIFRDRHRRLDRSSFGGFLTAEGGLAYSYGHRIFPFGGMWAKAEAVEIASALNHHLQAISTTGDGPRRSPVKLRTERPTEF